MPEKSTCEQSAELDSLAFLEQLESKHNQVLTELDQLNARIEGVLADYLNSRRPAEGSESSTAPSSSERKAA